MRKNRGPSGFRQAYFAMGQGTFENQIQRTCEVFLHFIRKGSDCVVLQNAKGKVS